MPHTGPATVAVALAVLSTACDATPAVLQEREAAAPAGSGPAWMAAVARRPWWWLALALTGAGAVLHVAAPAYAPLSLVQPFGVLTLVLALPLGARLAGRTVSPAQWRAAAAVAVGLGIVLVVVPHGSAPTLPPVVIGATLLGEPVVLTPLRVGLGPAGFAVTAAGIRRLALPSPAVGVGSAAGTARAGDGVR